MYHKSLILQGRPHDWNVFSECVYVYVYMCTWTGSASVYQLVLIWFLTVRIKNILGKTWLWEFFLLTLKISSLICCFFWLFAIFCLESIPTAQMTEPLSTVSLPTVSVIYTSAINSVERPIIFFFLLYFNWWIGC